MQVSKGQGRGLLLAGALFISLFIVFAVTTGIGYPEVPPKDVALVEGASLPPGQLSKKNFRRTFRQTWLNAGLEKPPRKDDPEYQRLRREAISDLLDRAWMIAEAREEGLRLPRGAVKREFERIRQNQFSGKGEYRKFLRESGFNTREVIERIRLQLFSQQLQVDLIESIDIPSSQDIAASYEENPSLYAEEDKRNYQLAVIDFRKVEKVKDKILAAKSAKEFSDLSKRYSIPRKDGPQSLPPEVAERLPSYFKGEIGGPVPGGREFYFFYITDTKPGKIPPLEEGSDTFRQKIASEITAKARESFLLDYQDKWRHRTFCQEGFITSKCRNEPSLRRLPANYPACRQTLEERGRYLLLIERGLPLNSREEFEVPDKYIQEAAQQNLICPPPVVSRNTMPPGGNREITLSGEPLNPALPQSPLPSENGGLLPGLPEVDPTAPRAIPPVNPYRPGIEQQPGVS